MIRDFSEKAKQKIIDMDNMWRKYIGFVGESLEKWSERMLRIVEKKRKIRFGICYMLFVAVILFIVLTVVQKKKVWSISLYN